MGVYITGSAVFLPNKPVDNGKIEAVLGRLGNAASTVRDLILERNGIKWRYYALDPETGKATHTNAELTAAAVHRLLESAGLGLEAIEVLACGTSSPDQIIPNHASMVHGQLKCPPCEIISAAGVCCSGMSALRYAQNCIAAGTARSAVVTGSELASASLKASQFSSTADEDVQTNGYVGFNQEFLRFMLSDGAGAVLIEDRPDRGRPALEINWLDIRSFANELDTCMYTGAVKAADGNLRGWRTEEGGMEQVSRKGYFNLSQDVSVLGDHIVQIAGRFFAETCRRRDVDTSQITWLLPHLSSYFFQQALFDEMSRQGVVVPLNRWFTNLKYKGNTGSASIYIMLDELVRSGKLSTGDQILCVVPESARFTFACAHLTVV